jgi:hypothetical protein
MGILLGRATAEMLDELDELDDELDEDSESLDCLLV